MLDVHPPHEAAHSWKDFFIHIATIVVGLLIAIGLEQIIERVHEHYQLLETREALEHELENNRAHLGDCARNWRWEIVTLEGDLATMQAIQQHPGIHPADLPDEPMFVNYPCLFESAVWDAAEKNGITRLMPLAEANRFAKLYAMMAGLAAQDLDGWNTLNDAGRYRALHPDPTTLAPAEIDDTLRLLEIAYEKKILEGYSLGLLNHERPDLQLPVNWDEVGSHMRNAVETNPAAWAAAQAKSMERLRQAGYVPGGIVTQTAH